MDGPPPEEEDFSVIPISDRLAHKNWKARVSAYESLIKIFQTTASDSDPAFKPYLNNPDLLKKIATDSNAVAQEKGVECLVALVKFAGENASKTREVVIPALVDKCFGSTRAGTKNQAVELALQYVEVENAGTGVVTDILSGLSAKQPKAVAGSALALKEIIRLFGIQVTPPPSLLKALPKIFAHSDKTVRAEGTGLAQALYQYMGPALEPWLGDLKPVQVKELKESFEAMETEGKGKGSLKPERFTRAQARELESYGGGADDGDAAQVDEEPQALDPRAFAEPVNIVPKLASTLQASFASSKWKDRKEALDDLLTLLSSTQRIKDAPEISELAKSLAVRIQSDANVACVMTAASCLEALAKGMMNAFGRYREAVVGPMMDRLKERKATVTDTIGAALDAVFATTTFGDILPDIVSALASKNPQVKEGALKFLSRCLSNATTPIPPSMIKTVADPLVGLTDDGFEGARNEAMTCLGTLQKMVGERPMNAVLDGLADIKKAKVKEAYEKATVKCKAGSGAPAKSSAPPKSASDKKAPPKKMEAPKIDEDEGPPPPKPAAKPPARLTAKKPAAAGAPPSATSASAAPSAPAAKKLPPPAASKSSKASLVVSAGSLDVVKFRHTPEDAEALAVEVIPNNLLTDLGDANWKTRLAALEEMTTWVESVISELDSEVLVRALAKKGWAEKNFQVSAKLYGILFILAEKCPSFGRSSAALCVAHLSEKLGDMKLKKPAGDSLVAFAGATSLQFVLGQAYDPLSKQKAPKVLADALTWVTAALTEFGIAGLSLRSLIEFLKASLQNSNAAVRTSATKTLVTLKIFAGSSIKDFLEDLNPQLLSTINGEFDKVEGQHAPEPTRTSADLANLAAPTNGPGKGAQATGDPLDDLFPRVEVDGLMKGTTILADAKSESWKSKKEALETFQAILDQGANKRLKPNMGEIAQILKARVLDSNKSVQTLALDIVARIAAGMGKPFEKQTRFFAQPVATVLSDQKAPIRASAVQTLTAMATACEGLESMLHGLNAALESTNPLQKASLLSWLADWFREHEPSASLDLNILSTAVVASLDDRSPDIRKAAQSLLPTLITNCGYDHVLAQTNGLKPASRTSAIPVIQAAKGDAKPRSAPPTKLATSKPVTTVTVSEPSPVDVPPPAEPTKAPASKLAGVRRKLPLGTTRPESRSEVLAETTNAVQPGKSAIGLPKRPTTVKAEPEAILSPLAFTSMNLEAKKSRLAKDGARWINEGGTTRKDLAELLQHQMEPHTSKELISRLFSHDHNAVNDHVLGLTMIADLYTRIDADDQQEDLKAVCLANSDLALKYASIKAHEPQSNLIAKGLDVVEAILAFLRGADCQISDAEALCFIPTFVHKLGDAREPVRVRVQQIVQTLPKVYAYSRVFQLLLDHGLKSKIAKTRQGTLDELGGLLKRSGIGACEPSKALPIIASTLSDKDPQVRKSALNALSEAYVLVGEKVWSLVGHLSPKDKTQLEERLRRVAGPSSPVQTSFPPAASAVPASRIAAIGGIPRPASPATTGISRLTRPASPAYNPRSASPTTSNPGRPASPAKVRPNSVAVPPSPSGIGRPKGLLPSKLGQPRSRISYATKTPLAEQPSEEPASAHRFHPRQPPPVQEVYEEVEEAPTVQPNADDITVTISSILSSDPSRSVDALKKVQKILSVGPEAGPSSPEYQELAEHTEGLIETITLQMAHTFERPEDLVPDENFRLAKHLIQTLNNFCDHAFLAESLTVDILTSLLEELTLRLLETDDSQVKKVKDLSRFINMIILRLFATGRRMSIFRALFALLLQIVKPFPSNVTMPDSKEAKVAELVLKCVWKLARNIPQDLSEDNLDPVELFPAIEHFLQSVPPNEWRARATNKVPCGDMPLRTIKVIIQHVVAHYRDESYDLLSSAFDDPSATIVYPYVYRILNNAANGKAHGDEPALQNGPSRSSSTRAYSQPVSRPDSPPATASSAASGHQRTSSPSHRTSPSITSSNGNGGFSQAAQEPDPDAQLLVIIGHISSETTGAMHKEGITELHHFLKAYPHKRARVDKMLDSTGAAFRKYITRALASRAAEDQEREVVVADTLSKLEGPSSTSQSSAPTSPHRSTPPDSLASQEKLNRLHDLFQYRSSTSSSLGHARNNSLSTASQSSHMPP